MHSIGNPIKVTKLKHLYLALNDLEGLGCLMVLNSISH
jgi:hypothetical protein